jgi:hypothetical protein
VAGHHGLAVALLGFSIAVNGVAKLGFVRILVVVPTRNP